MSTLTFLSKHTIGMNTCKANLNVQRVNLGLFQTNFVLQFYLNLPKVATKIQEQVHSNSQRQPAFTEQIKWIALSWHACNPLLCHSPALNLLAQVWKVRPPTENTKPASSEHTPHVSGTNLHPGCTLGSLVLGVLQCNMMHTSFQHPSAEYYWTLTWSMPYLLLASQAVWQQVLSYPYRILPLLAKYFTNFTVLKSY